LAGEFPDLSEYLNALIARLVDLLPIVRGAVYLPEFQFSNSIKSVAPALCPGFSYDDLDSVADGGAASAAFLRLASGYLTVPKEVDHLRSQLLAYCQRRGGSTARRAKKSGHPSLFGPGRHAPMKSPRWIAVSQSSFAWELEALEFLRKHSPDYDPWRAWSKPKLSAYQGRPRSLRSNALPGWTSRDPP
jgi:hypothetical protein